jgi:hypothetical protein
MPSWPLAWRMFFSIMLMSSASNWRAVSPTALPGSRPACCFNRSRPCASSASARVSERGALIVGNPLKNGSSHRRRPVSGKHASSKSMRYWMPACAGMTDPWSSQLISIAFR